MLGRRVEEEYRELMVAFHEGRIPAVEFQERFLAKFRCKQPAFWRRQYRIVSDLMADVDAYCHDPAMCNEFDIGEAQLRTSVERALAGW